MVKAGLRIAQLLDFYFKMLLELAIAANARYSEEHGNFLNEHCPGENADAFYFIRQVCIVCQVARSVRIVLFEGFQDREIASVDYEGRFNFAGRNKATVFFNDQVTLRAAAGPPEKKPRFTSGKRQCNYEIARFYFFSCLLIPFVLYLL